MKKTLSDITAKEFISGRLNKLSSESRKEWGKMNVNQMLRHLNDSLKSAMGKIPVKQTGNFIHHTVMKSLVLWGMPAPKGKVQTFEEIDIAAKGINPENLDEEREGLMITIDEFLSFGEKQEYYPHPAFGKMSVSQWRRLVYLHIDHHLKQFGV
jgi:hypothetical protein